jgi:hypothetical protein
MIEHLNLSTDFSITPVNGTRGETVVCMKDGTEANVVGYSDVRIEFEGRMVIGELKPPFKESGLFHTAARQPKDQFIMQQQIFSSCGFLTDSIAICAGLRKVEGEITQHLLTCRYMTENEFIIIILMQLLSHEEMSSCFCAGDEVDSNDEMNNEKSKKRGQTKTRKTSGQLRSVRMLNIKLNRRIRSATLFLEVLLVRSNET